MEFINPSVEIIENENIYKFLETVGRVCYKSEDKITDTSYETFIKNIISRKHYGILEHKNLVFKLELSDKRKKKQLVEYINYLKSCKFLNITDVNNRVIVSGNIRAIFERNVNDSVYREMIRNYDIFDLSECNEPMYTDINATMIDILSEYDISDLSGEELDAHIYRTVKIVTDRGISHELVRHRMFSFAQESTRYCNYSAGKFGSKLKFVKPSTFDSWSEDNKSLYVYALSSLEQTYLSMTSGDDPLPAQLSRSILPNSLKTEIIMTGNLKNWTHFIELRYDEITGKVHPDMKIISSLLDKLLTLSIKNEIVKKHTSE